MAEEVALAGQFDQPADFYDHKVLEKQPCNQNTQSGIQMIIYLHFRNSTRDTYAANAAPANIGNLKKFTHRTLPRRSN